jgi:hypothetical protein
MNLQLILVFELNIKESDWLTLAEVETFCCPEMLSIRAESESSFGKKVERTENGRDRHDAIPNAENGLRY